MFDIYEDVPVGIDLGTTYSCIGYWDGKEVNIVPNRMGERTTPSVIYLYQNQFIIGEEIQKDLNLLNNSEKIYSLKRIIGQDYNDEGIEKEIKNLHYNIVKGENNKPSIKLKINGEEKYFTPEYLCSKILEKLVNDLKKIVAGKIEKVVISVPAYFDDAQRCATIEAAQKAGLKVIRIINEPTAAALSYGLGQNFCPIIKENSCFSNIFKESREIRKSKNSEINNNINNKNNPGKNINNVNNINNYNNNFNGKFKINNIKSSFCLFKDEFKDENNIETNKIEISNSLSSINSSDKGKNVLVFDLGGGTFDLAILNLNCMEKEYKVKSKYSDIHLGGDDFDNKLADYCINKCNFEKLKDKIDKKSKERLKKACEYAKKILSKQKNDYEDNDNSDEEEDITTTIRIDNFIENKDLLVSISKKQFENEICKELFDRLKGHFDELLKGADLKKNEIEEIILVGGSTRMPKIKKIIKEEFRNIKINDQINPDEVVAYGATIQAAMLLCLGNNNNPLNNVKLFDITPISLGTDVINKSTCPKIQKLGCEMSVIIPKWTKIPYEEVKEYKTIEDNQKDMQISIFEGENKYLKYNKYLDQFTLIDLPKKPKGQVICVVNFSIDENSILTVKAYEKSEGKSKQIKVISSNRNQKMKDDNNLSNASFSLYEFNDFKRVHETNVQKFIKKFLSSEKNEDKIKALEIYNKTIKDMIKQINPDENPENINEGIIEKYFFYVYQLLESYEEILFLNANKQKENDILKDIEKYINIFKKQSTYYIKEILELFKIANREIFLNIFYYSIKAFNESGLYYLNNLQKMSRYYAKLYFEEVLMLYKKYIIFDDELYDIKKDIEEEKKTSEKNLNNINTNAILLIKFSKKERRLIDPSNSNELLNHYRSILGSGETGFTYFNNLLNVENEDLNYEDYNLILDELNKIINEIFLQLKSIEDEDRKKELFEEKGICLGNIAKVKYIYQRGKEYEKYKKLLDDCIECAKLCRKDNNNCEWYKEALDLLQEIEGIINANLNNEEEEINNEIEHDLEQINSHFHSDKQGFIDYILEKHPYDGYDKNTRPIQFRWDNIERDLDLIKFLIGNYKPDNYPKRTKEEKKRHKIIVNISQKLNKLYDDIADF